MISKRDFCVWKGEQETCNLMPAPQLATTKGNSTAARECLLVESFISFSLFLSGLALPASVRLSMQLKPSFELACVRLITAVIDGVRDDLTSSLNTRLDICLPAVFACFPPVWSYLSCYSLCHWTYERRLREQSAVRVKPTIKAALIIKLKSSYLFIIFQFYCTRPKE